jgi:predicted O-methyltransferase YrrM
VDPLRFRSTLPSRWDEFPTSDTPRDPRFAQILAEIPGLSCANNLALLNHAAACLAPGEAYVEVGSHHGCSLIAAMLDNRHPRFIAIDDFVGDISAGTLRARLAALGRDDATIIEGDAFDALRDGVLEGANVGVYYYDAAHSYQHHLAALRLIEPYLASDALVIVDDSDWPFVARATREYLATQPRARLLLEIDGKHGGQPWWWRGVQVLAMRRGQPLAS